MKKKLMFVVNVDWFFVSHRLPIALEAMRQGYEVHIATGITDQKEAMEKRGLIVHPIKIDRSSSNLFGLLRTLFQLFSLFRKVRPDLVHLVTIKPVLLGGVAARMARVPTVVAAISGLGYVFLDRGWKSRIRMLFVGALYRIALGHTNLRLIFQNSADREILASLVGSKMPEVEMIRGSGVDLNEFSYSPPPSDEIPIVLMAGRLIRDKGIYEFIDASRLLLAKGVSIRFCIAGSPDSDNPSSLSAEDLLAWVKEGCAEWWGQRNDMAQVLSSANVVVLPSYGEGVPKVLLEAAAVGRAVITTDAPGCRDAIEVGVTGILVPVRNAKALAVSIECLIQNRHKCVAMGLAGRNLAEREFDVEQVVKKHMEIYQYLMSATA